MTAAPRCCTVGMKVCSIQLVHEALRALAVDRRVAEVRILRRRVIAPDRHAADVVDVRAGLLGELRERAVVVEARHRGEMSRLEARARCCARSVHWCWRDCRPPARAPADRRPHRAPCPAPRRSARWRAVDPCAPCPGPRGRAPTSIAAWQSRNATLASSVATTLFSVGKAQSFSSMTTPLQARERRA